MDHPEDLLVHAVDGDLSPEGRVALDAHLAACASCRADLQAARRAKAALATLSDVPVPFGVVEPVLLQAARPARRGASRGWATGLVAAAALVAAVAIVRLPGNGTGGSPEVAAEKASAPMMLGAPNDAAGAGAAGGADVATAPAAEPATDASLQALADSAFAAGTPDPVPDLAGPILDCVLAQAGADFLVLNTPVEVLEANYAGQMAYVGVFLVSAVPGGDPIGSVVRVVDASNCGELSALTH